MELDKCDLDVGIEAGMEYERNRPEYEDAGFPECAYFRRVKNSIKWLRTDDDLKEHLPRTSHMRQKIMEARRGTRQM